jgi:hypothetical protein
MNVRTYRTVHNVLVNNKQIKLKKQTESLQHFCLIVNKITDLGWRQDGVAGSFRGGSNMMMIKIIMMKRKAKKKLLKVFANHH